MYKVNIAFDDSVLEHEYDNLSLAIKYAREYAKGLAVVIDTNSGRPLYDNIQRPLGSGWTELDAAKAMQGYI